MSSNDLILNEPRNPRARPLWARTAHTDPEPDRWFIECENIPSWIGKHRERMAHVVAVVSFLLVVSLLAAIGRLALGDADRYDVDELGAPTPNIAIRLAASM